MKKALALAAFSLAAAIPSWQAAFAQTSAVQESSVRRYAAGLALEQRGDEQGAFVAFLAAAEAGHPPAQRKLGEIYDMGNTAVKRNYQASIKWYEKAREGGEVIPPPRSPMPTPMPTVTISR
jgi:TPR repeat protein